MTTSNAVQVSREEEMASIMANIVGFLQDATHLPALRKELEALRAECESLKRQKEDLTLELHLEREARQNVIRDRDEKEGEASRLHGRLCSLQHKFDTIQGIVAAAMAEAKADEPRFVKEEAKPWTPTPVQLTQPSSW
jgi:ABC-type phosphate transport system auxiliary subunit